MHHAFFWAQLMANLGLSPWLVSPVSPVGVLCTLHHGWPAGAHIPHWEERGEMGVWWKYGNHAPCSHVEISELITFSRRWSGQCCVGSSSRIPAQLTPGTWHHGIMAWRDMGGHRGMVWRARGTWGSIKPIGYTIIYFVHYSMCFTCSV